MNNRTTVVIEWDEFPKGKSPEFYFLKYQLVNNFAEKVRHLFFLPLIKSNQNVNLF